MPILAIQIQAVEYSDYLPLFLCMASRPMGSLFPVNFDDTILNMITLNAATIETS